MSSYYNTNNQFNDYNDEEEEVFSLSFSNNESFMNQIPLLSNTSNDSLYSSSIISSSNDSIIDNDTTTTPALLSSNSSISSIESSDYYYYTNNKDDIFQLDNDFQNYSSNKKNNDIIIDMTNKYTNNVNIANNCDSFANVAQQNYRIWASSV
ncbi:hypothetical protein C6P45_003920 [Maudiozyma exigua]|uniref:Uncharacterized protein n=1 Tax=Maudiozyma exigua TaxID=34358 RepID=A0A9P6WB44_MAUEX|nr:hypothetical protein C6P45_003920 [Kazachstania exigua]